jgi:hypothetical protein
MVNKCRAKERKKKDKYTQRSGGWKKKNNRGRGQIIFFKKKKRKENNRYSRSGIDPFVKTIPSARTYRKKERGESGWKGEAW